MVLWYLRERLGLQYRIWARDFGVVSDIKELEENCQGSVLAGRGGLLQSEKGREARKESWGTANTSEVDRRSGNNPGDNLRYHRQIK